MTDNALTHYKMADAFAHYEKESLRIGFSEAKDHALSPFFRGTRLEMNPEKGRGWAEILQIDNGLYVGLCNYCLKESHESLHCGLITPIQFSILLSGHFDVQIPGEVQKTIGPGDIWVAQSHQQQTIFSQLHNDTIRGISIGLPAQLIENWLGNYGGETTRGLERLIAGKSGGQTTGNPGIFPFAEGMPLSTRLMRTANKLLLTEHQTIFGKLHFEALALEILAQILTLEGKQIEHHPRLRKKNRAAVDTTVDILREEWVAPPTISSLAKRVGTNECYLKKGFRNQTGMSIGEYIRKLRMSKALNLLETGNHSITEIAVAVGYTNPSHFSAAFKKFYGETPSRYLAEVA